MRKAIKKHGKQVNAYQLGAGHPMEQQLVEEGVIIDHGDGTYELFSQEAVNGSGEVAKVGDYFKVNEKDGKYFPYPNEKSWFEEHHKHISEDIYEQIPQPVEIYQLGDKESKTIQHLIDSGELKVDMSNPDKTFSAHLWGADLSMPRNGTVVIYGEKEDGSIDFNLVQEDEFEREYMEIKKQVVAYEARPTISMNIQALLFEHPLYETIDIPSKYGDKDLPIRILVLGSEYYAERFLDLCLQAGQMKGYFPKITVMSDSAERAAYDCYSYCYDKLDPANNPYSRQDMVRFVNISENGIPLGSEKSESYGSIDFIPSPDSYDQITGEYDYIFIALGEDQSNYETAHMLANKSGPHHCPVCYVCETNEEKPQLDPASRLCPVYVNRKISSETIDPQLETMAFNVDLSWNPSRNVNIGQAFKDFQRDPYRRESSMEFAFSLKYKLFSVGIILEGDRELSEGAATRFHMAKDWSEAADLFAYEILADMAGKDLEANEKAKEKFNMLMWLEHRRWVLYQIENGWSVALDEEGRMNLEKTADLELGVARNDSQHTHACLVFSTQDTSLDKYTQEQWDCANDQDATLDELDRMSVELHRALMRYPSEEQLDEMSAKWDELFGPKESAGSKVEEKDMEEQLYLRAMRQIKNQVDKTKDEEIRRAFGQFEFCLKNIYMGVIKDSGQFEHYKSRLEEALNSTTKEMRECIIPLLDQIEKNFSPLVQLNLCRDYKKTDEAMIKKIPFILTYSRVHGIVMVFDDGRAQNGRNDVVFTNVASVTVLCPEEICYLYCFDKDSDVEFLAGKLSAVLDYMTYRRMSSNVALKLAYIGEKKDRSCINLGKSLEKLKGSTNAVPFKYEIFVYKDYEEVLDAFSEEIREQRNFIYDGSTSLCSSFVRNGAFYNRIQETAIPYVEFDWKHKKFIKHDDCDYLKYFDDNSYIRIEDMFKLMGATEKHLIPQDFRNEYESMWEIYIGKYLKDPNQFIYGVSNWNRLCDFSKKYQEENNIPENELAVSGLDINKSIHGKQYGKYIYNLLKALQKAGHILDLHRHEDKQNLVDFRYCSQEAKQLLTKAGEILEIHTYYKALETGYFDDVVTGYEFEWKDGGVNNELDLVLTKGLQSVIVECKGTYKLEAEFTYTLYSLAELFGIDSSKVLVWTNHYATTNQLQENRGIQMGITTISGEAKIKNIGAELKKMIQ